jgi:hypothetical protein
MVQFVVNVSPLFVRDFRIKHDDAPKKIPMSVRCFRGVLNCKGTSTGTNGTK